MMTCEKVDYSPEFRTFMITESATQVRNTQRFGKREELRDMMLDRSTEPRKCKMGFRIPQNYILAKVSTFSSPHPLPHRLTLTVQSSLPLMTQSVWLVNTAQETVAVWPWYTFTEWMLVLKSHTRKVVSLLQVTINAWEGCTAVCVSSCSWPGGGYGCS